MTYPELTLISHKLCPYVQRARIVLAEKQIPHTIEFIDLGNKPPWFDEVSPLGKVPVLLVDGKPVFESSVIAEYLDEVSPGSLLPDEPLSRARARGWVEFASATLANIARLYRAPDESSFDSATCDLRDRFAAVELQVGDLWFFGDKFTLVDAAFGPVFRYFEVIERFGDFGLFDSTPNVYAWRAALSHRASVRDAVVPDYAERLLQFFLQLDSELSAIIRAQEDAAIRMHARF